MTDHQATLDQWHEALVQALMQAPDAVPIVILRMQRDGWADEAETARRLLLQPRPAIGALLGHDLEATRQLDIIREAYRAGGLDVLRSVAGEVVRRGSEPSLALLIVEAVLTIEDRGPGARAAEARGAFDRAEAAKEAAAIQRGGGR